jgi:hypothetical protein
MGGILRGRKSHVNKNDCVGGNFHNHAKQQTAGFQFPLIKKHSANIQRRMAFLSQNLPIEDQQIADQTNA